MHIPDCYPSSAEQRNKIVHLFACKGFGQVGMRELATCLGISAGSIYHHFPSKQHLLFDLVEEFQDASLNALSCIEEKKLTKSAKVNALIEAHRDLHVEFPLYYRLAEREFTNLSDAHQTLVNHKRRYYEHKIVSCLGLSKKPTNPKAEASALIIAKLLNNVWCWLESGFMDDSERHQILYSFLQTSINQLQTSESSG